MKEHSKYSFVFIPDFRIHSTDQLDRFAEEL